MKHLIRTIRNYWNAESSNVFKNYQDALFGLVVLVILPATTIYFTIQYDKMITFWNYTFPFVSIALAGLYDIYGRYAKSSDKNPKLVVRLILNCLSIFFAALSVGLNNCVLSFIAPALLTMSGCVLLREICVRVIKAIQLSKWYR